MNLNCGVFTVSLDFELYWGLRDKETIEQYGSSLRGVRKAVPKMLRLFSDNGIHATWATVGFLFFKNSDELKQHVPRSLPQYRDGNLSPYKYTDNCHDIDPIYHFAPELIDLIRQYNGQELGTHTFSHYYCLAEGQTSANFHDDIVSAIRVAQGRGISVKTLVFPRNQWNPDYLPLLIQLGIECYRGNEFSRIYRASNGNGRTKYKRALRLMDTYFNLTGHNVYDLKDCKKEKPFDFPSSRFLRPYTKRLAFLDRLKLNRITRSMSYAAANNKIFHLWWHPHNFGVNTRKNIDFLGRIVRHYGGLKAKYGMASLNMSELSEMANER